MTTSSTASPKISLSMAISIGIKAIIGASLFTAPSVLQVTAGPAGIITYLLVSIAAIFMALSIARVAALYPEKGAFYTYAKAWGGHLWGVLATLSYFTGLIIALGLLAYVSAGIYIHAYLPSINPTLLSIGLISLVVAAHLAGAAIAQKGQKILLVLTYIPIILITALCLLNADINNLTPFIPNGWTSIFTAVPVVIFGFFGFEAIPSLFADIENPEKNVPKAIIWTMLLVGATYIVFAGSVFIGLPRALFTSATTPISVPLLHFYPTFTWIGDVINWTIIIAITGVLHAMTWSLSSLAIDTSHHIFGATPSKKVAIVGIGLLSMTSCILFSSSINLMFSLTSLFIVFAYATAIAALILQPHGRSLYQIVIALCGLLTAALMLACGVMGVLESLQ